MLCITLMEFKNLVGGREGKGREGKGGEGREGEGEVYKRYAEH